MPSLSRLCFSGDGLIAELAIVWINSGRKLPRAEMDAEQLRRELKRRRWVAEEYPGYLWITEEGLKELRRNSETIESAIQICILWDASWAKIVEILPTELDKLPEYLTDGNRKVRKAARYLMEKARKC